MPELAAVIAFGFLALLLVYVVLQVPLTSGALAPEDESGLPVRLVAATIVDGSLILDATVVESGAPVSFAVAQGHAEPAGVVGAAARSEVVEVHAGRDGRSLTLRAGGGRAVPVVALVPGLGRQRA